MKIVFVCSGNKVNPCGTVVEKLVAVPEVDIVIDIGSVPVFTITSVNNPVDPGHKSPGEESAYRLKSYALT